MSLNVSDIAARLGDALLRVRTDAGIVQEDLAARLDPLLEPESRKEPISQTWVFRREKGMTEARPSEILAWEQVSGARPGTVYQLAGLVAPDAVTKSVIANDALLRGSQRRTLISIYDEFIKANAGEDDA